MNPFARPHGKIAFQGRPGANSDMACRRFLPNWEPVPCRYFEDAFATLKSGETDLAMIPIDNSTAGRVAGIHSLLPDSGFQIVGEYFLPIEHQLLGLKGSSLKDIELVLSHEQALSQCQQTMRRLGLETQTFSDTAAAAEEVARRGEKRFAAVAPGLAAELYDLEIIEKDVFDRRGNTTRFIVLSREHFIPERDGRATMSSFVFRTHSTPASLYKALGGFATNGINITKLESYILDERFTQAQFYIDVEGHLEDSSMRHALMELGYFSSVTFLGTYLADPFRISGSRSTEHKGN
jgi:prephenate dehydratase